MKRKRFYSIFLLAISFMLVAGCAGGSTALKEESQSLKVMFWDEDYFFQEYGNLFAMKKPNIEIEVVSTQSIYNGEMITDYQKALDDFIEKEQPDVLLLNSGNFETYITDGKLIELDTFIERDKYDTETIYPALIDLLKEKGSGKLYGLSPTFSGNVIYYNVDLFKKHGVELPHDGMTWQNIIDLARRFPTEGDENTRIYGYGTQFPMSLSNFAQMVASTQGLSFVNPESMQLTMNTNSWKQVYQLALDATNSGALYTPNEGFMGGSMQEYYQNQPFLMGRMAMTVNGPYLLHDIKSAKESMKDYVPFELGMVAGPVDPAEPDTSREIYLNDVFAIRANSPNSDAAWELIKFINGEDYAKIKSRTLNGGLLSRMGFSKEFDGHSLDAFYKLKPKMDSSNLFRYEKIPQTFYLEIQSILDRELALVQENNKSLDDALQTMQDEGQAALDKSVREEQDKKQKEPSADTNSTDTDSTQSGVTIID